MARSPSQIGVAAMEVEQITLAAILHDVEAARAELRPSTPSARSRTKLALLKTHASGLVEDIPGRTRSRPHQASPRALGRRRLSGRAARRADSARLAHHPPVRAFDDDGPHVVPGCSDYQALRHHRVQAGTQFDPELAPEVQADGREPVGLRERVKSPGPRGAEEGRAPRQERGRASDRDEPRPHEILRQRN